MLDQNATAIATQVLCQEGLYLDRRDWKAWLGLYAEHAVYWVPAWRDEYAETDDPDTEVSLIYHDSRIGLEERVMRIQSRKSVTALPLPRTTHFATNIVGSMIDADVVEAQASWMVLAYEQRTAKQHQHFGRYEMQLKKHGNHWLIARKKIQLQNDRVPTVIDFYLL